MTRSIQQLRDKNFILTSLKSDLRDAIMRADELLTHDEFNNENSALVVRQNLELLQAFKDVVNTWQGQVELALQSLAPAGEKSVEKEVE